MSNMQISVFNYKGQWIAEVMYDCNNAEAKEIHSSLNYTEVLDEVIKFLQAKRSLD
jgi:hypothetical protein